MNDSFIAKSMFDVLAVKDRGLADRFLAIQKRALTDWIPLLKPDRGSHAGLVHLINVGRNVDKIIPDGKKEELKAGEIFLLLAAVLFHDIGRISSPKERKPKCGFDLSLLKTEEKSPPCAKLDWDHYKSSQKLLEIFGEQLGLPDAMTVKYCALLAYCHGLFQPPRVEQCSFEQLEGKVCQFHTEKCPEQEERKNDFKNTSIEPFSSVRIPLLAAVLRIADETENHWTRAINKRWNDYFRQNNEDFAKIFRQQVEDVEFCHAGECIVLHLEDEPSDLQKFADAARTSDAVLENWSPELRPLGIAFNRVFFETRGRLWRFKCDQSLERVETPMTEVMKKDAPTLQDQDQDSLRIKQLHDALISLSKITMGYKDFTLAAVEAEAGRPLNERDKWLLERMADWVPWAFSVDPVRGRVRMHIKKEQDLHKFTEHLIETETMV